MLKTDVTQAMIRARALSGRTPDQFARELQRLSPELDMSGAVVTAIEQGEWTVAAEHLVAASRVTGQPVSVLLGEMELLTVTLPALMERMSAVERRLETTQAKSA